MERETQGKEKWEKGAVWHQEGEILSEMLARGPVLHIGIYKVGPEYPLRNANSF